MIYGFLLFVAMALAGLNFVNGISKKSVMTMMLTTAMLCFISLDVQAQLKLGGDVTNIDDGSILELEATDKAFIPPRMTSAERDGIPTPLTGAVIYNIKMQCLQVNKGTPEEPVWGCVDGQIGPVGPMGPQGPEGPAGKVDSKRGRFMIPAWDKVAIGDTGKFQDDAFGSVTYKIMGMNASQNDTHSGLIVNYEFSDLERDGLSHFLQAINSHTDPVNCNVNLSINIKRISSNAITVNIARVDDPAPWSEVFSFFYTILF